MDVKMDMNKKALHLLFLMMLFCVSCRVSVPSPVAGTGHAEYFEIAGGVVISVSPTDGRRDTLDVSEPYKRIVCMSSTHVAYLSHIGCQDDIVGVNGLKYISDEVVRSSSKVQEVGDLDYEKVLSLKPDLLVASGDGMADYSRLEPFGIKVFHVYDYMERHPLARAGYVRLFGALTGHRESADSLFSSISERYDSLSALTSSLESKPSVLVNVPYKDAWYLPGKDSYLARLIEDAGASVAGSCDGTVSGVMTVEKAFALSQNSSFWLNPGWSRSLDELRAEHPLFPDFAVLREGHVYNNILRAGPDGGNDYYESGAVRPDLVLEDLINIFHPELMGKMKNVSPEDLHYYIELH